MSTFDSGAFQELEDIYRQLLSPGDHRETWRVFAANQAYRAQLESVARGLLRRRYLPRQRATDIVHEALLLLAQCLERRADLGFDPRFGPDHFLGWLKAVARSHCLQVLRRQRLGERCRLHLDEDCGGMYAPTVSWQIEFADAVQSLEQPLQDVVAAFCERGSIAAAARQLHLSASTAGRRLHAAIERLRSTCRPFAESGHLVGIPYATKKW